MERIYKPIRYPLYWKWIWSTIRKPGANMHNANPTICIVDISFFQENPKKEAKAQINTKSVISTDKRWNRTVFSLA